MKWGRVKASVLAALAAGVLCTAGAADDPADRLPNPTQEARARHLFQQLRCVVCQNESVDDSQAEIAGDIRKIVRTQIVAGRSDKQVIDFLVQRYGEFVLLRPTLTPGNLALWMTPFLAVLLGGSYIWIKSRQPAVEDQGLTEEEQKALEEMDAAGQDMLPAHGIANARDAVAIKQ
ncbi:MAG TPA: cytochrome c-type biogenesis protein [Caulobacteraceae bacterium]